MASPIDRAGAYAKNAAKEIRDYLKASNAAGAANAARNDGPVSSRPKRAAAADVATAKKKKEKSEMLGAILQGRRYR